MMILRVVGAAVGAITALNVLLGFMKTPEFIVADILIGVFLIAASVIPDRGLARSGLIAGNAYALGVFSVALARRLAPDGVFNPGLVVIMIVAAVSLVALIAQKSKAEANDPDNL